MLAATVGGEISSVALKPDDVQLCHYVVCLDRAYEGLAEATLLGVLSYDDGSGVCSCVTLDGVRISVPESELVYLWGKQAS